MYLGSMHASICTVITCIFLWVSIHHVMALEYLGLGDALHVQSCQCADNARDLHKMVDIHMLIIMYLIFMFNYHIHHACSVATAHTALAPMIRVGWHHFVWMDMSNVNGICNCTNFQMYSSFGINLHNKVSALLYGCLYLLAWWFSNITKSPTLYWCGMRLNF